MAKGTRPVIVGRRLVVPKGPKTARAIIRRQLALDRKTITYDLSAMLGISQSGAKSLMVKSFPLAPQHIDRIIDEMKLDEFDAYELRFQAALEAGWQLNKGAKL